ncbi:MAG: hypothetical protein U5K00_17375 [Melioribacteraceae bacterium]|nr:hypothetical protein [Melioribacteraceae bacterium]
MVTITAPTAITGSSRLSNSGSDGFVPCVICKLGDSTFSISE